MQGFALRSWVHSREGRQAEIYGAGGKLGTQPAVSQCLAAKSHGFEQSAETPLPRSCWSESLQRAGLCGNASGRLRALLQTSQQMAQVSTLPPCVSPSFDSWGVSWRLTKEVVFASLGVSFLLGLLRRDRHTALHAFKLNGVMV